MIVRADIYRDSILYYHYICSKKLTGAYPQVSLPNRWAHLNFQKKSTWIHRTILEIVAFKYMYMIVWAHQRNVFGSPKKNSWLRPQKHYVYCTLLLLLAGPEIATKHTGCPKKTELALCALWAQHIVYGELTEERTKEKNKKSWSCMMKSTTTTVVSKDSSLVVYTTTNIQSVSYY